MNKKILAPIGAALAMLAVSAGTTFALFTSKASSQIDINAGKVEVSSVLSNLQLFSGAWNDSTGQYDYPEVTSEGHFRNLGTAELVGTDKVEVERMSPMDRIEFDLTYSNSSTILTKVRTVFKAVEDDGLLPALKVTVGDEEFAGREMRTAWVVTEVGSEDVTKHIKIELPEEAGNEYQTLTSVFSFDVEAIQANAHTFDGDALLIHEGKSAEKATIAEALSASVSGDTIKLNRDLYSCGAVSLKAGVTLDGNGYAICGASSVYASNGGEVKNLTFYHMHNANNKQSGLYAESLATSLTVKDCVFDGCEWDAIQITPKDGAEITITGCTFKNTSEWNVQRYVHIQSANNGTTDFTAKVNGNKFMNCNKVVQGALEIYYPVAASSIDCSLNEVDANFRSGVALTLVPWTAVDAEVFFPFAGASANYNHCEIEGYYAYFSYVA